MFDLNKTTYQQQPSLIDEEDLQVNAPEIPIETTQNELTSSEQKVILKAAYDREPKIRFELVENGVRNVKNLLNEQNETLPRSIACILMVKYYKFFFGEVQKSKQNATIEFKEFLVEFGLALYQRVDTNINPLSIIQELSQVVETENSNVMMIQYLGLGVPWSVRQHVILTILNLCIENDWLKINTTGQSKSTILNDAYTIYRTSLYEKYLQKDPEEPKAKNQLIPQVQLTDIARIDKSVLDNPGAPDSKYLDHVHYWVLPNKFPNIANALEIVTQYLEDKSEITDIEIFLPDGAIEFLDNLNHELLYTIQIGGRDVVITFKIRNHHNDNRYSYPAPIWSNVNELYHEFRLNLYPKGIRNAKAIDEFINKTRIFEVESLLASDLDMSLNCVLYIMAISDPDWFYENFGIIAESAHIAGVLDMIIGGMPPGASSQMNNIFASFRQSVFGPLGYSEFHKELIQTAKEDKQVALELYQQALKICFESFRSFINLVGVICEEAKIPANVKHDPNIKFHPLSAIQLKSFWLKANILTGSLQPPDVTLPKTSFYPYRQTDNEFNELTDKDHVLQTPSHRPHASSSVLSVAEILTGIEVPVRSTQVGQRAYPNYGANYQHWAESIQIAKSDTKNLKPFNLYTLFEEPVEDNKHIQQPETEGQGQTNMQSYVQMFPNIKETPQYQEAEDEFRQFAKVYSIYQGEKMIKVAYSTSPNNPEFMPIICAHKDIGIFIPKRLSNNPQFPSSISLLTMNQDALSIVDDLRDIFSKAIGVTCKRETIIQILQGGKLACGARSSGVPERIQGEFMEKLLTVISSCSHPYSHSLPQQSGLEYTKSGNKYFVNSVIKYILFSEQDDCRYLRSVMFA